MNALSVRPSASRFTVAAAVAALSLGAPAGANAAGCQGAPGTSALEQYCEAIPDASGGRQDPGRSSGSGAGAGSQSSGSSSSSGSGAGVSSGTAKKLNGAGADGAAVEQLAGGEKPSGSSKSGTDDDASSGESAAAVVAGGTGSGGSGGGTGGAAAVTAPADPSNSPLAATTKAVGGGPTVGGGLVWGLLAMAGIGAVGAVVLRRHGSVTPPDEEPWTPQGH